MRRIGKILAPRLSPDLFECIKESGRKQMQGPVGAPAITVIMANFNAERWIGDAIRSVKLQRLTDWELIVVDDASTDASVEVARAAANDDPRIAILTSSFNLGPPAARNRALLRARGRWITVLDSDDLLAEGRLASLLAKAESDGAAIAADDLLIINESGSRTGRSLFGLREHRIFDAVGLLKTPQLGYLKPLIKAELLSELRYDERMRWAEDFDLLLRALVTNDTKILVYPSMGYHYRRRDGSLSTDKSVDRQSLTGMLDATARFIASYPLSVRLAVACARRNRSLETALRWVDVTEAIREGRLAAAFTHAMAHPRVLRCALRFVSKRLSLLEFANRRRGKTLWL